MIMTAFKLYIGYVLGCFVVSLAVIILYMLVVAIAICIQKSSRKK